MQVTVQAHYDSGHIVIDENLELTPNTPLISTLLSPQFIDQEHASWSHFSCAGLTNAHGDDEPEYILSDFANEKLENGVGLHLTTG
jgi:hypothetical protein